MDEATYEYIVARFAARERKLFRAMAEPAARADVPLIMISEEQAKFLRVLVGVSGARRVLDVGTLFGYSAAVMAGAMPTGGRVVSLELEERHAEVARRIIKKQGLGAKVRIEVGPALASMKRLPRRSFDLVLIDADKAGYIDYFEEAVRLVGPGGLVCADNALAWGKVANPTAHEPDVEHIRRFNDHVAARKDVEAILLPIGDGLLVARVLRKARKR